MRWLIRSPASNEKPGFLTDQLGKALKFRKTPPSESGLLASGDQGPNPNCARSLVFDDTVFHTSPKRERGKLVCRSSLALFKVAPFDAKCRFVVEFATSKTFHTKAQGREAHPGMTSNTRRKPQRGFTGIRVKPRWGLVLRWFRDPGCAARPWALLLNRVAVRHTAQLQNLRFGLVLDRPQSGLTMSMGIEPRGAVSQGCPLDRPRACKDGTCIINP
jgi:hypothetical protein